MKLGCFSAKIFISSSMAVLRIFDKSKCLLVKYCRQAFESKETEEDNLLKQGEILCHE